MQVTALRFASANRLQPPPCMTPFISCPACNRSLGRFDLEGKLRASCHLCQTSYEAIYGKLSTWSARREPLLYFGDRLPSLHRHRYDCRIATPGRDLKRLHFTTPDAIERVPLRSGDRVSILYSTRGHGMEKLMAIHNHSLGRVYQPPAPVPSRRYLLQTRGSVSTAVLLGALFGGIDLGLISLGAIALLLHSRLTHAAHLESTALRVDNDREMRLLNELRLVNQKAELDQRIRELQQESQDHRALIKRLNALRTKMLSFNASLYAARVGSLESAIRLLKQRLVHNQHLVDEYVQMIRMIELELEASSLAEQLPDAEDFTAHIFSRLDELHVIEAQNQQLRFQLEANAEVKRLSLNP